MKTRTKQAFDIVETFLKQETCKMESNLIVFTFNLDIVVGTYMAFRAGIGFDHFTLDDITLRNGVFCIKMLAHAKPISSNFTVLDSMRHFSSFIAKSISWTKS